MFLSNGSHGMLLDICISSGTKVQASELLGLR